MTIVIPNSPSAESRDAKPKSNRTGNRCSVMAQVGGGIGRAKAVLCTPHETGRWSLHGSKTPSTFVWPDRHKTSATARRDAGFARPDHGSFQGIRGRSWATPVDRLVDRQEATFPARNTE